MRHPATGLFAAVLGLGWTAFAVAQSPAGLSPAGPIVAAPDTKAEARVVLPSEVAPEDYDISIEPDAERLTFRGSVQITVTVHRPTRLIELNAADIGFDRVSLSRARAGLGAGRPEAPTVRLDQVRQTADFTFDRPLATGRYVLSIAYHGRIYQQASGLFALDYDAAGTRKRALFTQFENSDARRFVPSFDEPAQKASFRLSVTAPRDAMAISNMPVIASQDISGRLKRVRFAETPKMSSYLLFLGVGDFERVRRKVDGVDVGVVVKRGDRAAAGFALDAAAQLLPYYNAYFGVRFPLPKLDLIAGPGSSQFFGAMENWGAIFYFERDLLIDPRIATEADRQNVYITVAHEMAHQWFGDLVTMAWWDDLWLNEGFASWMENKATDHFHPEWKVWLQQLQAKQTAMQLDAKNGAHPVIRPIPDVLAASGAFDSITYDKGASVIRMLERYVGEDAWRAGIRSYIAHHAYANAVTDDLWREVDAAGPRKVTDIAHDFTLQAGAPMIAVEAWPPDYTLTQGRFGLDPADRTPRLWRVPVVQERASAGKAQEGESVDGAAAPLIVSASQPWTSRDPFRGQVVNAGQSGYYRVLYDATALARITARYPGLTGDDQLGILGDAAAEAYGGYGPMSALLELSAAIPAKADPLVWRSAAERLAGLDRLYDGLPGQQRFRAWAWRLLQPVAARSGWEPRPGEAPNTAAERSAVLETLAQMGDLAVLTEARRRFADIGGSPVGDPATRLSVMHIVAEAADAQIWERLHDMARTARSELERRTDYALLGRARDEGLARRALDLALTGEVAPTTAPAIIRAVGASHPDLALAFTAEHWARIRDLLEPDSQPEFAARVAFDSADLRTADALEAFASANVAPSGRSEIQAAEAEIRFNATVRSSRLPEADRWLAQQP